jgi:hypothetical protein
MAPKSKNARIPLGEPLATEFAALREVLGGGNTEIGVLRDAVRDYIRSRTKAKAFRQEYEAALGRLQAMKVQPLRLVKDDNDRA